MAGDIARRVRAIIEDCAERAVAPSDKALLLPQIADDPEVLELAMAAIEKELGVRRPGGVAPPNGLRRLFEGVRPLYLPKSICISDIVSAVEVGAWPTAWLQRG